MLTRTNCPKERSTGRIRKKKIDNKTIRQTNKHSERQADRKYGEG